MDLSRLPIFKLPASVSIHVFKTFDRVSLVHLSVISEKTMIMVRSVGFKTKFSVNFDSKGVIFSENYLTLKLVVGNYHLLFQMKYDKNDIGSALPTHICIISTFPNEVVKIILNIDQSSNLFKAETWIKNLKWAFHVEEIDVYLNTQNFSMRSICNIMRGVKINKLHATHNYQLFSQLVEMLHPPPNELNLFALMEWGDLPSYQRKVLIQNFRSVTLNTAVFLDDLLMTNVPRLIFYFAKLNNKELNFFIKFWIKTEFTKLEHLYLLNRIPMNEDVIFKGIDYVKQPDSRAIVFDHTGVPLKNIPAKGGYDITRIDGTTATIILANRHFRMIVWT
ncbi:unnamed protein product [Caenorhabditis brenneri]